MHGYGEKMYADGSRYAGNFANNKEDKEKVSFEDADGTQSFGTFRDDQAAENMSSKAMIPIEEEGQDNFEIRIGVYDMGEFLKWKLKYSNPLVTRGSREYVQGRPCDV